MDVRCPTVSAVIPTHDAAATIARALDSVFAQTYPNLVEVIVVDDGSTDDTCAIVREQYPQARLVRQENAGSAVARNHGVREAGGEYIAFLDDDDEWLPGKTATQMAVMAANPDAVLTIAGTCVHGLPSHDAAGDGNRLEWLDFRSVFPSVGFHYGCSGWIIQRGAFMEAGGFRAQMRRSQDTELLWRLAYARKGILRVRTPLYSYHPSYHRIPRQAKRDMQRTWYRCLAPVAEEFCRCAVVDGLLSPDEARQSLAAFYYYAGGLHWYARNRSLAREALFRAAKHAGPGAWARWHCRMAALSPALYKRLPRILPERDG
jgi:glycosyltransferase involved in cell wall biosynthesis